MKSVLTISLAVAAAIALPTAVKAQSEVSANTANPIETEYSGGCYWVPVWGTICQ
ncbi:MAG: hypothetical protein AAFN93_23325 [Bacteroidota bacterium]